MLLRHCLLGLINYGEMTGYELDKSFIDSVGPICHATTSQIYRELAYMEKENWLCSHEVIQEGKPNRKVYQITEEGKKELKLWLSKDHMKEELMIKHPFYVQMFFAGENSIEENIRLIKAMKQDVLDEIAQVKEREAKTADYKMKVGNEEKSFYWDLVGSFATIYYEQLIIWADNAIKVLEEKKKEG